MHRCVSVTCYTCLTLRQAPYDGKTTCPTHLVLFVVCLSLPQYAKYANILTMDKNSVANKKMHKAKKPIHEAYLRCDIAKNKVNSMISEQTKFITKLCTSAGKVDKLRGVFFLTWSNGQPTTIVNE